VDLGSAEDYSLHYFTVEGVGDNQVELTVVEDVVGPLDATFHTSSVRVLYVIPFSSKNHIFPAPAPFKYILLFYF
jgi:hypothetical protein